MTQSIETLKGGPSSSQNAFSEPKAFVKLIGLPFNQEKFVKKVAHCGQKLFGLPQFLRA